MWNQFIHGSWKNISQHARKKSPSKDRLPVRSFGPTMKRQRIQALTPTPKMTSTTRTVTTYHAGSSPRPSVLGVKSPETTHAIHTPAISSSHSTPCATHSHAAVGVDRACARTVIVTTRTHVNISA